MSELILHHYEGSPFSEKVRLVLGFKGLSWRSVTVPVIMPKPDVIALTGGYRRTPFLQIGADVYCDSLLMCQVIDQIKPAPSLFPQAAGGLAQMLSQWADTTLFWTAIPYALQVGGLVKLLVGQTPETLKAFGADRAAMTVGRPRVGPVDSGVHLHQYLGWLESELADGREFIMGGAASMADFSIAQSIWHLRRAPDLTTLFNPYPKLLAWYGRVSAFGHGSSVDLSSQEALNISAAASSHAPTTVEADLGFAAGTRVTVAASDYGTDPNEGLLVGLTRSEVVIERTDERAGRVHVHFPRIGYQIRALAS
ncbi:MAG: hypothetical protein RLZZ618_3649 [Pseudomonadota bacterium]|jgi:glutathione S-transferase